MKLSVEDKVQIYQLKQEGVSIRNLSEQFGVNNSIIKYLIRLMNRYGIDIIHRDRNPYYSPKLK